MARSALDSQARYEVRAYAEEICEGLHPKDYLGEYLAIYYDICARTRYMRDPRTVELVRAPYRVIAEIRAGKTPSLDCDDMATTILALVLAVGGQARITTVAFSNAFYQGQRQYSHVFAQAREPRTGQWITLDPVAGYETNQMHRRVVADRHVDVKPVAWRAWNVA